MGLDLLRHVMIGVLQALQAMHAANVVHRNLRPSCVFIDRNGDVRVANYSLESRINEVLSIQGSHFCFVFTLKLSI